MLEFANGFLQVLNWIHAVIVAIKTESGDPLSRSITNTERFTRWGNNFLQIITTVGICKGVGHDKINLCGICRRRPGC